MECPNLVEHVHYSKCYAVNYLKFLDELGVYNPAGCGYLQRNKNNQKNYLCLQKALY